MSAWRPLGSPSWRLLVWATVALPIGPLAPLAWAQDPFPVSPLAPLLAGPGGTVSLDRDPQFEGASEGRLLGPLIPESSGIRIAPVYFGEVFSNTKGGRSTNGATRYAALLDLIVELDFARLGGPLPGRFVLLGQNTHGQGLSEQFIGDFQTVSNIDSFQNIAQVSEYWWEAPLLDGNAFVRLGKQDVNTEFLLMDQAREFLHSSFGLTPSAGLPSYPTPSLAAVVVGDLGDSARLKAGLWDLFADGGGWGLSGNGVTLTIVELEYEYALRDSELPGIADLGVVYASGGYALGYSIPSISGFYVQLEQLLVRENPDVEGDGQGLGVFASYAPRFPNSPLPFTAISENLVGGMVYRGLLAGRDEDVMGVGAAWARLNRGGSRQETAFELFYKFQITPALSIQPDLQYIMSPSGIYPDALVAGLRFEAAL